MYVVTAGYGQESGVRGVSNNLQARAQRSLSAMPHVDRCKDIMNVMRLVGHGIIPALSPDLLDYVAVQ